MLTLRATEKVAQKFLRDPDAYLIHYEVSPAGGASNGLSAKALVWSPENARYTRVTVGFTAMVLRERFALISANIFDDPVTTSELYYFSYDGIDELKEFQVFSRGKPARYIMRGFVTHTVTRAVEVE